MPCVVMCGGASSRMKADAGVDKALLPFGDFGSLIEYQHDKLLQLFSDVYVSAKQKSISTISNSSYILDEKNIEHFSTNLLYAPTLSIYSALTHLQTKAFFVPVDMPLVSVDTYQMIIDATSLQSDAVVLKSGGKVYPTFGVYSQKVVPTLKQMILENRHKLQLFLSEIDTIYIELPESEEFSNINNYSDYKRILKQ